MQKTAYTKLLTVEYNDSKKKTLERCKSGAARISYSTKNRHPSHCSLLSREKKVNCWLAAL